MLNFNMQQMKTKQSKIATGKRKPKAPNSPELPLFLVSPTLQCSPDSPQPGPKPLAQKGDFPAVQQDQTGTHSMTISMRTRKARLL